MNNDAIFTSNPMTPCQAVIIDEELCTLCNLCVDVCRMDCFLPNPDPELVPVMMYPDECWFCGSCVQHCPVPGAIKLDHPLNQRVVGWKRKETGEYYRIGMKNPPPPVFRKPVGS